MQRNGEWVWHDKSLQIRYELEKTLRDHGCHRWKNNRNIMEAILCKLRTGAPWQDIPREPVFNHYSSM